MSGQHLARRPGGVVRGVREVQRTQNLLEGLQGRHAAAFGSVFRFTLGFPSPQTCTTPAPWQKNPRCQQCQQFPGGCGSLLPPALRAPKVGTWRGRGWAHGDVPAHPPCDPALGTDELLDQRRCPQTHCPKGLVPHGLCHQRSFKKLALKPTCCWAPSPEGRGGSSPSGASLLVSVIVDKLCAVILDKLLVSVISDTLCFATQAPGTARACRHKMCHRFS